MKFATDSQRTLGAHRLAWAAVVGVSLTLLPLAAAVAQSLPPGLAAPGSADLQQVVQRAIATNPEVQAAWNGLRASGNDVGVARGNYLPSVDVAAGVGREDLEGDGRGSYDTDFAELTLTQMIYDGFATRSEVERLDRAKLVRYYELLGASENVALEAARAYLDVSRYRELVGLAQDNYADHLRVFRQIEERALSGAGRGVDLQQISGRLALAESNLMTEASNLHDVTARYQRIVGELPAGPALTPHAQGFDDRQELPARRRQMIRPAAAGLVRASLDDAFAFELLQASRQHRAGHQRDAPTQVREPRGSSAEITEDERRPPLAEHLRRFGDGAELTVALHDARPSDGDRNSIDTRAQVRF